MRSLKHVALLQLFGVASFALSINVAFAQSIGVTSVRPSNDFFAGVSVDSSTGEAYVLTGYGPGYVGSNPTTLIRYASAATFEAGVSGTIITSGTNFWGTYTAAQNGSVFGRSSTDSNGYPTDAQTSKINGSTGAVQAVTTVAGMGGGNWSHTFDWGGFSAANVMNDGSRLYVVGGNAADGDWRISTYDYNLNALGSVTFSNATGTPGWGFAINGNIYFGDGYDSGQISQRVDASTGLVSTVNFTLTGISSLYINNASYDSYDNTLYLNSGGTIYKLGDASSAFGVTTPVPEPETYAMMLAGLGMLGFMARRRKQQAA